MSLELTYLMGRLSIHRMTDERLLSTVQMIGAVLDATCLPVRLC